MNWARLFAFTNTGAWDDNIVLLVNSHRLLFSMSIPTEGREIYASETYIDDNVWRHVVWTLSSDAAWSIYYNGVRVFFTVITTQTAFYPRSIARVNNYLGMLNITGDPYFNGKLFYIKAIYSLILVLFLFSLYHLLYVLYCRCN